VKRKRDLMASEEPWGKGGDYGGGTGGLEPEQRQARKVEKLTGVVEAGKSN